MTGNRRSRSSRSRAAIALGALMIAGVSSVVMPAAAGKDDPKSLTQTLTGAARADFDAARTLFAHDDFAGAGIKFRSAYDASHDPRLLWNIASCEQRLKHYARSRALLEQYLEEGGSSLSAQDRRDAEGVLRTIAPFVSTVVLSTKPEGVEVVVDGDVVGKTPLSAPLYVELGKHEVVIRKDGYRQVSRPIAVSGGDTVVVAAQLAVVAHEGTLEVQAAPGEMVVVDGENFGLGTVSRTVPSGRHVVRVTSSGRPARQTEVVIEDDQTKSLDLRPQPETTRTSTWLLVGGGAAILTAGAVVGAFFLFRPSSGSRTPQTPGTLGAVDLP